MTTKELISTNPADTTEEIGRVQVASKEDVEKAVARAKLAYPSWRRMSRIQRAEIIDRLCQLIKRETEDLAYLVTRECGKPLNEGRADVVEGLHMEQHAAAAARMPVGTIVASEIAEKDAEIRRKPRGVTVAITPWNFPFAIPTWVTAIPLVEGNTVILKPSEETPMCAERLMDLMYQAGMPADVFQVLHGPGEVGKALVQHPDTQTVLFTGSAAVAKEIRVHCAESGYKRCATEAGGKAGMVISDRYFGKRDAYLEFATNAALLACFKTTGQRCVSTSRLIVQHSIFHDFADLFAEKVTRIRVGNGLDPDVFMGPLINSMAVEKVSLYNSMVREAKVSRPELAIRILVGENHTDPAPERLDLAHGHFMLPFVYTANYRSDFAPLQEEVFGPHVAIVPYTTLEEAIFIHNDTRYGLAGGIISDDWREIREFREEAEIGLGYANLPTIGAEVHLPFGGLKVSGNGFPSAATIVHACTDVMAWTENFSREIKMAQGLSARL